MQTPIEREPGQLLFCGFEGTSMPDDIRSLIAAGRLGGVILFARNIAGLETLRSLTESLHAAAPNGAPILIAIDQEGGRVQRLREPWTLWPPMRCAGDLDDVDATAEMARALATELLDLGIALDFAPCVDVDTNPDNPVIGDRSFSRDSARVARHAAHFVRAMQAAGVAACAKHFPGHGDTTHDSHFELPRLDHDLARLREIELPPFRAAIEAGVASLMTAHVSFPSLDGDTPATLSAPIMSICRDELGYDGVVFSDDLEMKAVADRYEPEHVVSRALDAGVDGFLVCKNAAVRDRVLAQLEREPAARLGEPLRRMTELKRRYAAAGAAALREASAARRPPYAAHQRLAQRLRGPA